MCWSLGFAIIESGLLHFSPESTLSFIALYSASNYYKISNDSSSSILLPNFGETPFEFLLLLNLLSDIMTSFFIYCVELSSCSNLVSWPTSSSIRFLPSSIFWNIFSCLFTLRSFLYLASFSFSLWTLAYYYLAFWFAAYFLIYSFSSSYYALSISIYRFDMLFIWFFASRFSTSANCFCNYLALVYFSRSSNFFCLISLISCSLSVNLFCSANYLCILSC